MAHIRHDLDTARRHTARWRDEGYGDFVCGWPPPDGPRSRPFVREVVREFASYDPVSGVRASARKHRRWWASPRSWDS